LGRHLVSNLLIKLVVIYLGSNNTIYHVLVT
jgi:hypothetical protein